MSILHTDPRKPDVLFHVPLMDDADKALTSSGGFVAPAWPSVPPLIPSAVVGLRNAPVAT